MRVLKWIVDRVRGRAGAVESPFGMMPTYEDITWAGLDFSKDKYLKIMNISRDGAMAEEADQPVVDVEADIVVAHHRIAAEQRVRPAPLQPRNGIEDNLAVAPGAEIARQQGAASPQRADVLQPADEFGQLFRLTHPAAAAAMTGMVASTRRMT